MNVSTPSIHSYTLIERLQHLYQQSSVRWLALLLLGLVLSSCGRRAYVVRDFDEIAEPHNRIAILPFEVVYTGRPDPKLSPADIEATREREAIAFQQNLIDLIGQRETRRTRLNIDLLGADETLARLDAANIGILDAQRRPAHELTEVLGVDAIVLTRINKHRSLTPLESAAVGVLVATLPPSPLSVAAASMNRTYRVSVSVSAVDRHWHLALQRR